VNGLLPVREDVWQGGLEMCVRERGDMAEGSGTCSMHVEQEWVRICRLV